MKLQKMIALSAITLTLVAAPMLTYQQSVQAESTAATPPAGVGGKLLFLYADAAINEGNYDQAIALYTQAMTSFQPGSDDESEALGYRAAAFSNKKDYAKAADDYTALAKNQPKNAKAYRMRGLMYSVLEKYDLSLADATKSLELDPKNPTYLIDRAFAYNYTNEREKAKADLNAAREIFKEQGDKAGLKEVKEIMKSMRL
ncbi:MAG: tetratricopeptide repeat protein [Alkalinema sp. RU_4_3]|nr:tetratricopeptide repeat protein [Alkalinema sp. RU_4_3]